MRCVQRRADNNIDAPPAEGGEGETATRRVERNDQITRTDTIMATGMHNTLSNMSSLVIDCATTT